MTPGSSTDQPASGPEAKAARKAARAARGKLNAAASGLLLLWFGAAWLLGWDWGVGLVGAGTILLLEQAARHRFALGVDPFWAVAGAALVVGGALIQMGVPIPVGPILLIAAGGLVLASVFRDQRDR